jgi:enoyl-CoA hydratase
MDANGTMTVSEQDGVLHAVMCHPPANALDEALVEALADVVSALERGTAKVLVLSSADPDFFAVGKDFASAPSLVAEEVADYRDAVRRPLERLAACGRPSIAAIEGRALGAGLELAMACTLRFCSRAARMGLPDLTVGRIPGAGGTQRLPRLVGRGRALELMLTGREIYGDEAVRIGLAERMLFGHVVDEAHEIAALLARSPLSAMAAIMTCVDAASNLSYENGLAVEGAALLSAFEDDTPERKRRPAAA